MGSVSSIVEPLPDNMKTAGQRKLPGGRCAC